MVTPHGKDMPVVCIADMAKNEIARNKFLFVWDGIAGVDIASGKPMVNTYKPHKSHQKAKPVCDISHPFSIC